MSYVSRITRRAGLTVRPSSGEAEDASSVRTCAVLATLVAVLVAAAPAHGAAKLTKRTGERKVAATVTRSAGRDL